MMGPAGASVSSKKEMLIMIGPGGVLVTFMTPMLLWLLANIISGESSVKFETLCENPPLQYANAVNREELPPFQVFKNILSPTECKNISEFVHNVGLSPDPSSLYFLERNKNIRFIKVVDGGFEIMNKNYFKQSDKYNDFSGGYDRHYDLIPEHVVLGPMFNLLTFFIEHLSIPVNTIILAHLQSSSIRANIDGGDVTGQGIHTDGSDDVMMICVKRDNVLGAENQYHASLDGSQLLGSSTLEAGDGVVVKDNEIFHYVTKATTNEPIAHRIMIVIHSPFDGNGDQNPNNKLGKNPATNQLRYD
ncbi:unnamed protein product [Meganyctiphanes norvegica]|uniref:2OG-Fe dioxygenase family protein n=1 Tax=Meganyctiphanes norvegica TaxID=48144 RepID=A0AAV2SH71_MEGNR